MKKFIDITLIILFLCGLSSMFLPIMLHKLLGYALIILVIIHNILNRQIYRTRKLTLNVACIIAFAVSLIVLTISGFMQSTNIDYNWRAIHLGSAIASLICLIVHLLIHARRHIKSKLFRAISFVALLIVVAGVFGMPYLDRWFHKVEVSREIIKGERVDLKGKVITVYFSRVGNTNFSTDVDAVSGASIMRNGKELIGNAQMIAMMTQNAVGGELFEIKTSKTYPASYSETVKIAKRELADNERLDIKPISLNDFDKMILIYPLWWSTLPKPIEIFLNQHDFSGKTIIPIVTHGGGGIGDSVDVVKRVTKAHVVDALDIYSSDIAYARSTINDYLNRIRNIE